MKAKGDYRPRQHINRVLAGSAARLSARTALEALCRLAEFDRPEVTFSKPQLQRETRLSESSVDRAIRELRAEGSIEPIQGLAGGRSRAVTYRLVALGQGAAVEGSAAGQGDSAEDRKAALRARVRELQNLDPGYELSYYLGRAKSEGFG